jgi:hypothetical protein
MAERMTAERISAERMMAERMTAERMTAERMTVERMMAEKMTAERMTAERVSADGVEEKVGPIQKQAMLSKGISWVGMTVAVWMAAEWMAAATRAMAYHMKEALAGDSFSHHYLLTTQLHNDVSLSVLLVVRWPVVTRLQLGRRLLV